MTITKSETDELDGSIASLHVRHYSQAFRIRYSTESFYETPLYHSYPPIFLILSPHLQPLGLVDLLYLVE